MLVNNHPPVLPIAIPSSKDIPDLRDCFYIFEKIVKLPKKLLTLGPNIQKFEELQQRVTARKKDENWHKVGSVLLTAVAVACLVLCLGCLKHLATSAIPITTRDSIILSVSVLLGVISPFAIGFAGLWLYYSFLPNADDQRKDEQWQLVQDHLVKIRKYFAQEGGDKLNELIIEGISTKKRKLEEQARQGIFPSTKPKRFTSIKTEIKRCDIIKMEYIGVQREIKEYDVALRQWQKVKKLFCDDIDKPSAYIIPTYIPNNLKN